MTQCPVPSPVTLGVHHVGLSVSDLSASTGFFLDVLGFSKVGEKPNYPAAMVSDGHTMITLWQVTDPDNCQPFDRHHNVGLHHLALLVSDENVLSALHTRLIDHGVSIEFAPEPRADGKVVHMMCNIPGGPRVEFMALTPAL